MTVTDPFAATSTGPTSTDPFNAGGDPFGAPAPRVAKAPNPASLRGRLLLYTPKSIRTISKSVPRPGGGTMEVEIERCTADIVVLDGPFPIVGIDGRNGQPTGNNFDDREYEDVWVDNIALVNAMRKAVAKKAPPMVLGRLTTVKNTKPGMSDIWVLQDPTPADIALARAYLAKTADPFA